ncbi:hypothetical protein Hanom_Chr06g00569021 [Helianthus anomalus]
MMSLLEVAFWSKFSMELALIMMRVFTLPITSSITVSLTILSQDSTKLVLGKNSGI